MKWNRLDDLLARLDQVARQVEQEMQQAGAEQPRADDRTRPKDGDDPNHP